MHFTMPEFDGEIGCRQLLIAIQQMIDEIELFTPPPDNLPEYPHEAVNSICADFDQTIAKQKVYFSMLRDLGLPKWREERRLYYVFRKLKNNFVKSIANKCAPQTPAFEPPAEQK